MINKLKMHYFRDEFYFQVTIYFNHKLLRGNRSTKLDSGAFNAFHSPNLSPLAELEIDIRGRLAL